MHGDGRGPLERLDRRVIDTLNFRTREEIVLRDDEIERLTQKLEWFRNGRLDISKPDDSAPTDMTDGRTYPHRLACCCCESTDGVMCYVDVSATDLRSAEERRKLRCG